ncbi:MAG: DUF5678 domain-containing protein [bacterium]
MTQKDLNKEVDYLEKNTKKLLKLYREKYVLIKDNEVISSYDTYETAAQEAVRIFGTDTPFLIHFLTDDEPVNLVLGITI